MKNEYEKELILIGQKIKTLRIENKLTQQVLADCCEVDIRTIQRIEKGIHNPTYKILFAIAKALNLSIIQLLNV